jgi:hypothetical protein
MLNNRQDFWTENRQTMLLVYLTSAISFFIRINFSYSELKNKFNSYHLLSADIFASGLIFFKWISNKSWIRFQVFLNFTMHLSQRIFSHLHFSKLRQISFLSPLRSDKKVTLSLYSTYAFIFFHHWKIPYNRCKLDPLKRPMKYVYCLTLVFQVG